MICFDGYKTKEYELEYSDMIILFVLMYFYESSFKEDLSRKQLLSSFFITK